jgi:hypothetical protein
MSLAGRVWRRVTGRESPARSVYDVRNIDLDLELPFLKEQIRANASTVPMRAIGPALLDNFTRESPEMREAYRRALSEPAVKAALFGKICAVMNLGLQVKVAQDTPLDHEVADFTHYALTRCRGGLPALIWAILSGGLIDGYSACEKVWRKEQRGRFEGKVSLLALKSKDTRFIQYELDPYRNVVGVFAMRGNSGQRFSPSDFVLFRYQSLFENPFGLSDLRAAYRAIEMIPKVFQKRLTYLDKLAGPFLHAKIRDPAQRDNVQKILAQARGFGFLVSEPQDELEILDLAGTGTSEFLAAIEDLRKEIAIAISGAFLTMYTGGQGDSRGSAAVQQDTVDLFVWALATLVTACIQEQLVPDLVGPNYGSRTEYPTISLEAPNPEAIVAELAIDESLHLMGLPLSRSELYERTGRRPPKDPADAVAGPAAPTAEEQSANASPAGQLAHRFAAQGNGKPAGFAEWREEDHPRGGGGEFGSGGAGGDAAPAGPGKTSGGVGEPERPRTHSVVLPRNPRKLTTGQVHAGLTELGYKVGRSKFDLATKQPVHEITDPTGKTTWASTDEVAEILYRSAGGGDRRPGRPAGFAEEGRWITIGAHKGEDGKRVGGSPVMVKDGRIVKGHPSLVGEAPGSIGKGGPDDRSTRKQLGQSKDYAVASIRKQARQAGHDPEHLDQLADDVKKHADAFAGERKELLRHAREYSKGNGYADLRQLNVLASKGKHDATMIPGFDLTAESAAGEFPHHFRPETGEHGSHADQLFDMLTAGDPHPMDKADAYQEALDHMENERHRYGGKPAARPVPDDDPVPFAEWKEEDHPRGGGGQFGHGGAGGGGGDGAGGSARQPAAATPTPPAPTAEEAGDHVAGELAHLGLGHRVALAVARIYPHVEAVARKLSLLSLDMQADILDTVEDYEKITYSKMGHQGQGQHDPIFMHTGIPANVAFKAISHAVGFIAGRLAKRKGATVSTHAEGDTPDPVDVALDLIRAYRAATGREDEPLPSREEIAASLAARQAARAAAATPEG